MTQTYPPHPQLQGNYAPLRMECDLHDLVIEGEMPRDLNIHYYRNGPDPQYPPMGSHHWFAGDGMVHSFRITDGKVSYINRWPRTRKWTMEREAGRSLFSPFNPFESDPITEGIETDGLANTNIVWHAGKLLALEEGHAPFEMHPESLESMGSWRFQDKLEGPMTAHPKIDPETGEMLFFGYMAAGPFSETISYQAVNAQGELTQSIRFEAPFASMVHDFITTRDYAIFPVFPLTGNLDRVMSGGPAFAWQPEFGSHVAIMPRNVEAGGAEAIRWIETDPCYVFHPVNAYQDGERIIAHMLQYEVAPLFPDAEGNPLPGGEANARLCEWEIDLKPSGGIKRRYLDDIYGEFPRLDERFTGLKHRYGYYAALTNGTSTETEAGFGFNALVLHDFELDRRHTYELPIGDVCGEPIFVPRSDEAPEGDGYLLSLFYRGSENRSDLVVFNAADVEAGPIAVAQLPHRIPFGFHGNWRPL